MRDAGVLCAEHWRRALGPGPPEVSRQTSSPIWLEELGGLQTEAPFQTGYDQQQDLVAQEKLSPGAW